MNTLKALWAIVSGIFFIVASIITFMLVGSMMGLPIPVSLVAWLGLPIYGAVLAVNKVREDRRIAALHAASVVAEEEAEAARQAYEAACRDLKEAEERFTVVEKAADPVEEKPLWKNLNLRNQ